MVLTRSLRLTRATWSIADTSGPQALNLSESLFVSPHPVPCLVDNIRFLHAGAESQLQDLRPTDSVTGQHVYRPH